MLSTTDTTLSKDRKEVAAHVATQVNALPNLTDKQRETVLEVATAWAFNHGTLLKKEVVDGKEVVTPVGEPNYAGIANHVKHTLKIS
jgi:hypothetical protein